MTREKQDDKRQSLLLAGRELFSRHSFHEVTIDLIAKKARVAKGTVYTYFADKEELFFHVASTVFEEAESAIQSRFIAAGSFLEKIRDVTRHAWNFFSERHGWLKVLRALELHLEKGSGATYQAFRAMRTRHLRLLENFFEAWGRSGELKSHLSARELTFFYMSLLHAREMYLVFGEKDIDPDPVLDLFLRGVLARPGESA